MFVPHPSGLRCPDAPLSSLECRHQPSSFQAGRGNRLCQPLLPCQSRFLFTPSPPLGTGAWRHSPRTSQGLAVQGLQREGTQGLPWGIPQHTHLSLP